MTLMAEGKKLTIDGITFDLSGDPDYEEALNKPSIENITLDGNKSLSEFGLQPISASDITRIIES